jgi:D-lactate dehydrogenase
MKVFFFDTRTYDKEHFKSANVNYQHELHFYEGRLTENSAPLAFGHPCVCSFVNDQLNRSVLETLVAGGTKLIALRSAGYNHIDLQAAKALGLKVTRVPEYSPHAVAEHAVALILTLNRKLHRSYNRVREGNFSLEGLEGFDLFNKKVGVIGTGKIGKVFIQIMRGFGTHILAYDPVPDLTFAASHKVNYVELTDLLEQSDVISLHLPLNTGTHHLINYEALKKMKKGAMLINTGRGKLIDTKALISVLKSGHLGSAGLDVYEEEEQYFFNDHSSQVVEDDILARLMTFPNVLLTSHQGFLTKEALDSIAQTTLQSVTQFETSDILTNEVSYKG